MLYSLMDMRETLVAAALTVLEQNGAEKFTTRAVCSIANVTAPTLYHHFGSADGLLSAAVMEAHRQFLERKKAAIRSSDPELALEEGWEDFVRFAAERPRLYAAMMARLLQGGDIPAFGQGYALLVERVEAIAAAGRLAMAVKDAAQTAWASANAASLLHVAAALQVTAALQQPDPAVIDGLRDRAMKAICKSRSK
jgi:AcrR family transcriptional regulator